ncbi:THO complex subunit 6 [Cucurbita argyrosperma subsp. argyrosperma]|nr:THO complex subunit 6 [Cucurbita argyrosperma subsp. argyrosperma]
MLGDATNWDEDAYRESLYKEREVQTRTVFRTAWAPSLSGCPESIVVASSDGSIASYSIASCISKLHSGYGNTKRQVHFILVSIYFKIWGCKLVLIVYVVPYSSLLAAEPHCFLQGHDGPTYDVKFFDAGDNTLLLSCGDDGHIRGWRWNECTDIEVPIYLQGSHIEPVMDLMNPQYKGPWGALSPIPENNAIATNAQSGSIFSAAGDSCAYCWDLESGKIKMVFKGHSDYLHCIVARNTVNQIITGSEDGTARIWDCKAGKCIQVIDPAKDNKKQKGNFSCVRCIALDASESWLACADGRSFSVWNLPASDFISRTLTRSSMQDMVFCDNQILGVGAEPLLTRFDIHGSILSEIQCAPQSAFSVAVHPSGVAAVGGYGGLVDVISQFGSHLCTFCCQYR